MIEKLAKLCHDQWSGWVRYIFRQGIFNPDGSWTMSSELAKMWTRQTNTEYSDLSKSEQDSYKLQADRFMSVITDCPGEFSDGHHTFNELYEHRYILFVNLALLNKINAFKTRLADDGTKFDGHFILGINTTAGQITYHLPDKYWLMADVKEVERNSYYDGHTSADVLDRLEKMALG